MDSNGKKCQPMPTEKIITTTQTQNWLCLILSAKTLNPTCSSAMYVARAQLQAAAAKLQLQGSTVQCHPQTAAARCWFGPWITLAMHLVSYIFLLG